MDIPVVSNFLLLLIMLPETSLYIHLVSTRRFFWGWIPQEELQSGRECAFKIARANVWASFRVCTPTCVPACSGTRAMSWGSIVPITHVKSGGTHGILTHTYCGSASVTVASVPPSNLLTVPSPFISSLSSRQSFCTFVLTGASLFTLGRWPHFLGLWEKRSHQERMSMIAHTTPTCLPPSMPASSVSFPAQGSPSHLHHQIF